MTAAQGIIDRIVEALEQETLTAEEINKLANAYQRVIQTMQLIEGDVTERKETITRDGADLAIRDLINEAKARNLVKEEEIKQH